MTRPELLERLAAIQDALDEPDHRDLVERLIEDIELAPPEADRPILPGRAIVLRFDAGERIRTEDGESIITILDRLDAMAGPGDSITLDLGGGRHDRG